MEALEESAPSKASPSSRGIVRYQQDLVDLVSHHFETGSAAERFVEDSELFEKILEKAYEV